MLIRHMEHWAHRLFPQLQFENVVERIESLGNKKPVQACLKRIRLDLPLLNEDFRSHEGEDENNRHSPATEEPIFLPETQNSQKESGSPSLSPALTEEQQQRIERNRRRALERRQAKNQLSQSPNHDLPTNEDYDTLTAQEKDEACIHKAGVPFQPREDMQNKQHCNNKFTTLKER
uniref:TIMELESS-interacting protein n=1 Tax=Laticauda laticaudata TaxID=8630 RepID=A0A8C5WTJ6_LATLA